MTCGEASVVAFLNGELSDEEARRFDQHLIECEACWRAVHEDRIGRLATEQLRVSAPPGLGDRVTASIELAAGPGAIASFAEAERRHRRSLRTVVLAAAAAVAVVAGTLAGIVATTSHPVDPPQVAAVEAMLTSDVVHSSALAAGERLVIGGQSVTVRSYKMDGAMAIVATSMSPFPMPAASHLMRGSSSKAWMATKGGLALYGVNRHAGERSMFVVAALPMAELPEVAARLRLI